MTNAVAVGSAPVTKNRFRTPLIVVSIVVLGDGFVGTGIFGTCLSIVGFAMLISAWLNRRTFWLWNLKLASIYLVGGIVSVFWIEANWKVSEKHSEPVIAACESYRSKYGHYPSDLNSLTPEFLPSTPHAGYTLMSRQFGYYVSERYGPVLHFSVMEYGASFYYFNTHEWRTND